MSSSGMNGLTFSVLTLNIWGLPDWISKDKEERVKAIGRDLSLLSGVDVICLQEVWVEKDYLTIKNALNSTFPNSHYFYSGVTGSGVCVFTKWPITDVLFHQWPLNGYIHMVHHGDWFGGKGVGMAVLDVRGYKINVYTTHLHAQYHQDDSYLVHRVEQAFDTAMFIKLTSEYSHFSVLAGDLNTHPGSLCERLLLGIASLSDSYSECDAESKGGTYDCLRNSYGDPSLVAANPDGERIDYIFYKESSRVSSKVIKYRFPLEMRIPGKDFSYSDHEAVQATFELKEASSAARVRKDTEGLTNALKESVTLFNAALDDTNTKSMYYWCIAAFIFLSLLVTPFMFDYTLLHSSFFYVHLIVSIVLLVFFVLMATIWCKLEFHAVLGARDRMVVLLNYMQRSV